METSTYCLENTVIRNGGDGHISTMRGGLATHPESKQKVLEIIERFSESEMETSIEVLQLISRGVPIEIHLHNDVCYTNLSNQFLRVTKNDPLVEPDEASRYLKTLNEIQIINVLPEYIMKNGKKFNNDSGKYGLISSTIYDNRGRQFIHDVNISEVFNDGEQVVYRDYIFYVKYSGSICYLYATESDYLKETNEFCMARRHVKKIVPVEYLDELKQQGFFLSW